jgi:hypothetical protein
LLTPDGLAVQVVAIAEVAFRDVRGLILLGRVGLVHYCRVLPNTRQHVRVLHVDTVADIDLEVFHSPEV